jgi:hypothetical protein
MPLNDVTDQALFAAMLAESRGAPSMRSVTIGSPDGSATQIHMAKPAARDASRAAWATLSAAASDTDFVSDEINHVPRVLRPTSPACRARYDEPQEVVR